jgi:hypothetical protein
MVTYQDGFIKMTLGPHAAFQKPFWGVMRTLLHLFRIHVVMRFWKILFTVSLNTGMHAIKNRASASMSPYKADFTSPLIDEKRVIHGFKGSNVYTIYKGTLLLTIQDDDGNVDEVRISNSYHVPSCPYRIISPQHWAQEVMEATDDGTGCITYSDRAILFWKGGTR